MYRNILVAYNGTQESVSAIEECIRLGPGPAAQVHLLAVIDPPSPRVVGDLSSPAPYNPQAIITARREQVEADLLRRSDLLVQAGLTPNLHIEVGEPVDAIENAVARLNIELLIVGHPRHRSWATRWWRGSTDAMLMERVRCALLIAPVAQ